MSSVKIIAEIGWNHMGDMSLAEKMIESAASNGADYAKFQTWAVKRLKDGEWDNDGRRQIYENAELSVEKHKLLISLCEEYGIKFLSSVFSIEDAELLVSLGVSEVKIPSFESRNHDLIEYCNLNFDKIFMSTGTSTWDEIKVSAGLFEKNKLVLMHCVSAYPCEPKNANLYKMKALKDANLSESVGYSDHIFGVESAKVALGHNISVVEKHFTIDRNLPGRDNKFAILPDELKELKRFIDLHYNMHIEHGNDFLSIETDSSNKYAGRFNKK